MFGLLRKGNEVCELGWGLWKGDSREDIIVSGGFEGWGVFLRVIGSCCWGLKLYVLKELLYFSKSKKIF